MVTKKLPDFNGLTKVFFLLMLRDNPRWAGDRGKSHCQEQKEKRAVHFILQTRSVTVLRTFHWSMPEFKRVKKGNSS